MIHTHIYHIYTPLPSHPGSRVDVQRHQLVHPLLLQLVEELGVGVGDTHIVDQHTYVCLL